MARRTMTPELDALAKRWTVPGSDADRQLRDVRLAASALVDLVRWCDRNDWGCVPRVIELRAHRAAARLGERKGARR